MSYVKVYKFKKQISLDNGATWNDVIPTEYKLSGEPIGYYDTSAECELGPIKLSLALNDSSVVNIECDSTNAITSGEVATQYSGTVVSAQIGNCVSTIGNGAFCNCYYLSSVTISNSNNAISIGNRAFYDCVSLQSIILPDNVVSIDEWAFCVCERATGITIGNGVTTIGDGAFMACRSATTLTIGNSVTTIGEGAFQNCEALTSITIPNSVITIGKDAFSTALNATSLTIGSGVTSIGKGAFNMTGRLQSITIYATTPPTLAYEYEFYSSNCPIYVPCESVDAYKSATNWSSYANRIQCIIGEKFTLTLTDSTTVTAACDSTSAVTYYEIVPTYSGTVLSAEIGDCVTTIGNQAFHDCKSLKNVIIGSGVTSIGYEAFYLSNRISGVTINATTPPTLGESAFLSYPEYPIYVPCDRIDAYKRAWPDYADRITCKYDAKFVLTLYDSREITAACDSTSAISRNEVSTYMYSAVKAVIGDCVTTINHFGFYMCTSLSSVTIPDSVTIIGNQAFLECRNISKITINSTIPPYVGYDSFGDSTYHYGIYVPSESVNAYKTAWPNYADRIFANPYN